MFGFKSPNKIIMGAKSASARFFHRARGLPSTTKGHQASFHSNNSQVKFSIKSFKVPELYIEVPETATVGSLKRTVMETVTAILGGELHVGVLLQGKKVREDNRTLLQTGISCSGNLDTLGFTLEPCISPTSPPVKDPPLLVSCEAHQQSPRSPDSPFLELGCPNASSDPPPVTNMDNHVESHHEPTIFVEIIQRVGCMLKDEIDKPYQKAGCGGFGKGNFSELFNSIEEYEKTLEARAIA